eukprot:scaffold94746_cov60-Phaeocystis_antarctica.AAC.2
MGGGADGGCVGGGAAGEGGGKAGGEGGSWCTSAVTWGCHTKSASLGRPAAQVPSSPGASAKQTAYTPLWPPCGSRASVLSSSSSSPPKTSAADPAAAASSPYVYVYVPALAS